MAATVGDSSPQRKVKSVKYIKLDTIRLGRRLVPLLSFFAA